MNLCNLPSITQHSIDVIEVFVPFAAKVLLDQKRYSLLATRLDAKAISVKFDPKSNAAILLNACPFNDIATDKQLDQKELKKILSIMDVPVDAAYKRWFSNLCVMLHRGKDGSVAKQLTTTITPPIIAPASLYINNPIAERAFINKLASRITQIYATMTCAFYDDLTRFILELCLHFVDVENQDGSILLKDRVIGNYRYTLTAIPCEFNSISLYSDANLEYFAEKMLLNPLIMNLDVHAALFIDDEIVTDSVLGGVTIESNLIGDLPNNTDVKYLRKKVFSGARLINPKTQKTVVIEKELEEIEPKAEPFNDGYWSTLSF